MRFNWRNALKDMFAVPAHRQDRALQSIARFEIGFCPGCRRLRGTASLRCGYCDSTAPVSADA